MFTRQIIITAIALIFSVVLFEHSGIDIWVQDYFYRFETGQWLMDRHNKIAKIIFYDGIKKLIIASVVIVLIGALVFRKSSIVQNYKQGLLILIFSAILVPSVVGILKATTNVPCPNDLKYYGGTYPHVTFLQSYPADFNQAEKIQCYPAGHASGGFALLSLIFLFKRKRNRVMAGAAALSLGWSMALYKMLIGDHFLSHTIVTMLLAWLMILIVAHFVYLFTDSNPSKVASSGGEE